MSISPIVQEDINGVIAQLGSGIGRLSGKNVLMTGCTGFLGAYALETLARLNDSILASPCRIYATTRDSGRVWARFPHLGSRPDMTLIEGDIRTLRLPSVKWDYVIHGAASSDAKAFLRDPLGTMDGIVEGTRSVLTAAADARAQAVLFISTGAVYGHQPVNVEGVSEDYLGGPDIRQTRSCYAEAKRYSELLCQVFCETRRVPVSILRFFALVGPYQDMNSTSAVIDFIRQALNGDSIRIKDTGMAIRSYCYIADAIIALFQTLLSSQPGEVLNFGSDREAVSFRDLAHRIGKCVGKPISVIEEGGAPTGVLGNRYVPDVTRFSATRGFRPTVSLDEALTRTIAWMKEDRMPARLDVGSVAEAGSQ